MSCEHTFDQLRWFPGRQKKPYPPKPSVSCAACDTILFPAMSAKDFLEMRAYAFVQETRGKDPSTHRDMFYHQLDVGMTVAYPVAYSSSVQMSEAEIFSIDHGICGFGNEDEIRAKSRHGEPWKIKLLPTGRTSRSTHYWSGRKGNQIRPVTLSATAGSVIAVS